MLAHRTVFFEVMSLRLDLNARKGKAVAVDILTILPKAVLSMHTSVCFQALWQWVNFENGHS